MGPAHSGGYSHQTMTSQPHGLQHPVASNQLPPTGMQNYQPPTTGMQNMHLNSSMPPPGPGVAPVSKYITCTEYVCINIAICTGGYNIPYLCFDNYFSLSCVCSRCRVMVRLLPHQECLLVECPPNPQWQVYLLTRLRYVVCIMRCS